MVSIRSPDRSQGRQIPGQYGWYRCQFQSAPLTGARGDLNSGETSTSLGAVSIRSPDRSQGRRCISLTHASMFLFQSAPLTGARGDEYVRSILDYDPEFQSAPLTGARGDFAAGATTLTGLLFQSAPLTGARGDLNGLGNQLMVCVSIRSPDRSQGRLPSPRIPRLSQSGFNPLP